MREKGAQTGSGAVIARLAARQHGVVSVRQLIAAGLTHEAIRRRVEAGRLHRMYRGVYAVGHTRLSNEGRWKAAVLACGEGAVLSHRSAAANWGLWPASNGPIDVAVPTRAGRKNRQGIRLHRPTCLLRSATTIRKGIPTTTPERTVADLRRVLARSEFERVIAQAEVLRLPIGTQRACLQAPTRSELERHFLRLCRRHRLPKPEVNVRVDPYEVDFLWRDQRLIVETDGFETHGTRSAFEADRARDARLKMMGYEVLRFTYRQVTQQPAHVAKTLRRLLA
jgi:very-short-patch-repair endonuclease